MNAIAAMALVLAGGFGGGIARFFLSGIVANRIGETFPWGTIAVNITGCFAIGLLAGLARESGGVFASEWFHGLFVTGFCGGYTTVSSFALQTLNLGLDGENRLAIVNVAVSVAACMAAVAAGFWIAAAAVA